MNENYAQPDLPEAKHAGVMRGAYVFAEHSTAAVTVTATTSDRHATLLGSGAILTEVIKAAEQLASEGVCVTVISVTSWSELARDGMRCEADEANDAYITKLLAPTRGPIIAATDYVRLVAESIRAYVPITRRYVTLGTDGFGRSDTRTALRDHFGVDAAHIRAAALKALR